MKIAKTTGSKRGIAMTEYLIILAVVAIAAITIVGLFGKQIKANFFNSSKAMQGDSTSAKSDAAESDVKSDDMGTGNSEAANIRKIGVRNSEKPGS